MGWFKKEPLHQRLAREGGLTDPDGDRETLRPSWDKAGIHGAARPRRWDAVVSADAPDIPGSEVEFVTLPDGSLVVEEEQGDGDLSPLAEAVEAQVKPPYRASGVRKGESVWAVAARSIKVATFAAEGEEIELSEHNGFRTLTVDGSPVFGSVPELEKLGQSEAESYVARARRLDGEVWEVSVDPL